MKEKTIFTSEDQVIPSAIANVVYIKIEDFF